MRKEVQMAKNGNMSLFIYGKSIKGSRFVGNKKKNKRIKRGK